jgi:hypothetical protein
MIRVAEKTGEDIEEEAAEAAERFRDRPRTVHRAFAERTARGERERRFGGFVSSPTTALGGGSLRTLI